jgi:holo-[acyl-carrier protein] synthase
MIRAIGLDIVDIDRFEKIAGRWQNKFLSRLFTQNEIEQCQKKSGTVHSLAARFAAKEALIKCIPSNTLSYFDWHEAEILNTDDGKPYIRLYSRLDELFKNNSIFISLSHSDKSAAAVIVVDKRETQ